MRPIDTQCFIFTVGTSAVLAFRGSQPIDFFHWFFDLSVNTLPVEKKGAFSVPPDERFPGKRQHCPCQHCLQRISHIRQQICLGRVASTSDTDPFWNQKGLLQQTTHARWLCCKPRPPADQFPGCEVPQTDAHTSNLTEMQVWASYDGHSTKAYVPRLFTLCHVCQGVKVR